MRPFLERAPFLASTLASWIEAWRDTARAGDRGRDLMAGLTVAAVALPLNVALALAAGLPVASGLMAGAVGGAVAAVFGGSNWQVTGPAAALNTMVLLITKDFGPAGVAAACLIVGVVQAALAAARGGLLMRFVPEAVLAGFTTGVGLKLLAGQAPILLGARTSLVELSLADVDRLAAGAGFAVIAAMAVGRRWPRVPAALIAVAVVTAAASVFGVALDRVGAVAIDSLWPSLPRVPAAQWGGLVLAALPLGLLAGIESLVSARAVDRLAHAKKPHDPSLELFGQALANIAAGLFRAMPVSGVIVRSSVAVQCGARSRLAALTHAVILLAAVLALGGVIAVVPLAALAGLLCFVGYRLIELRTLAHLAKEHSLLAAAFAVTAVGTATGYLMTGLVAGLMLAALRHALARRVLEGSQLVPLGAIGTEPSTLPVPVVSRSFEPHPRPLPWLRNILERPVVPSSSYVHPAATVIGRVVLGENVHIAADTSVRADEAAPFYIGNGSNVQDGVVIHALKDRYVAVDDTDWAVYVGRGVSVAHQALVHGPCFVGDDTFVGFKAVVHNSIVREGCYIGIGAVVAGVEIAAGRYVAHGLIVTTPAQAAALPAVTDEHRTFNSEVVTVNRGLVTAYQGLVDKAQEPC